MVNGQWRTLLTPKSNVSRGHQVHLSPGSYGPERGDSHEDEKERVKIGKKRWRVGTFILPQSTWHMLLLIINFFIIFFFCSHVVHFVLPLSSVLVLTASVLVLTASVLILTTLIYMDWVDFGVPQHQTLTFNLSFTDFGISNILYWLLTIVLNL